MISEVRMTRLAQSLFSDYIHYISYQFRNPQAARAVLFSHADVVQPHGVEEIVTQ